MIYYKKIEINDFFAQLKSFEKKEETGNNSISFLKFLILIFLLFEFLLALDQLLANLFYLKQE